MPISRVRAASAESIVFVAVKTAAMPMISASTCPSTRSTAPSAADCAVRY